MKLNRNFNLLLTGQSLANIGDILYIVSIIYLIFELTGSGTAAAFVAFTITGSMFLSNTLTPLLMEHWNLKWLLAGSQMGKTGLLFALVFLMPQLALSNFVWLFFAHNKTVYRYIYWLVKNKENAEDLTQDTFYKAFKNLHKFQQQSSESTWLLKIARNVTYDHFRRKGLISFLKWTAKTMWIPRL